ncbi:MAG: amidohydrolase family protein, partial [Rhodospirillaceae bacterium]|nr:amidohydrolase family protein [Rhodospirillaceae bacterium]
MISAVWRGRVLIRAGLACALAAGVAATARADLVVRNVTLYDGTGAPARTNVDVLVTGDKIAQIGANIAAPASAKVIDGRGKYLIPGLVESHMHLPGGQSGNVNNPSERRLVMDKPLGLKYLHGYLYAGVTTVFDSSNNTDYIFAMRDDEQAGRMLSPRIFGGGGIVTVPGGYAVGPASLLMRTWEQTKADLDARIARKPDMIKFAVDRQGVGAQRTLAEVPMDLFGKAIAHLNANGVRSTVHIAAEQDALAVIDAGATALAHPVWRSTANDAFVKAAVERKIPISTTLTYFGLIARMTKDVSFFDDELWTAIVEPEELELQKTEERERYVTGGMGPMMALVSPYAMRNVARLHQAGAILALGTDRRHPPAVHMELELLAEAGISPFDCIRIAT